MKNWLWLILCVSFSCKKKTFTSPTVDISALSKGVNLSNWFNDYSDGSQYNNRFSTATLQLLKNSGFTYVRIPIGATILFNEANPSQLRTDLLAPVETAINRCIQAGLAVSINLHPWKNDTDSLLANDAGYVTKVAAYWKAIATYFKKYPASQLFFEVYNEPHASAGGLTTQGPQWWRPVQEKMIAAIRQATAAHIVIAGGEAWNSLEGLLQITPYTDSRVIYNFHFYDPFLFTHQGATWAGWQPAIDARQVPYPSSPAAVAPLISGSSNTVLNDALRWYGNQQYGIDSIDAWIKKAYVWGQTNKVKVIVNEFGSYQPYAPRASRLNWLRDVRRSFEKYGIGWAMWECDEGFGLINYPGGNRNTPIADGDVLTALGLR